MAADLRKCCALLHYELFMGISWVHFSMIALLDGFAQTINKCI